MDLAARLSAGKTVLISFSGTPLTASSPYKLSVYKVLESVPIQEMIAAHPSHGW